MRVPYSIKFLHKIGALEFNFSVKRGSQDTGLILPPFSTFNRHASVVKNTEFINISFMN